MNDREEQSIVDLLLNGHQRPKRDKSLVPELEWRVDFIQETHGINVVRDHFSKCLNSIDVPVIANEFIKIIFNEGYQDKYDLENVNSFAEDNSKHDEYFTPNSFNHHDLKDKVVKGNLHLLGDVGHVTLENVLFSTLAVSFSIIIKGQLNSIKNIGFYAERDEEIEGLKKQGAETLSVVQYCITEIKKTIPFIKFDLVSEQLTTDRLIPELNGYFKDQTSFESFIDNSLREIHSKIELIPIIPRINRKLYECEASITTQKEYKSVEEHEERFDSDYKRSLEINKIFFNLFELDSVEDFNTKTIELIEKTFDLSSLKKYMELIASLNDDRSEKALTIINKIVDFEISEKTRLAQEKQTVEAEANRSKNYVDEKKQQLDAFNEVWEEIQGRVETIQASDLSPQVKEFRIAQLMEQSEKAKQEIFGL